MQTTTRKSVGEGAKAPSASATNGKPKPAASGETEQPRRTSNGRRKPGRTVSIVKQAATILEQEIAAGVVAAKRVEERFVNVKELRTGEPDALMHRFRRDTHDIVDILMDIVQLAVNSLASLTARGLSLRAQGELPKVPLPGAMPTLAPPNPIAPGESAEIAIAIDNDGEDPIGPIAIHCSDLVCAMGAPISASHIKCSPATLTLPPQSSERVTLAVHVPKAAAPGIYSGMIQATELARVRALLVIEVRAKN